MADFKNKESNVDIVISVLDLLGTEQLKTNVDNKITCLLNRLTATDKSIELHTLDILYSLLLIKCKLGTESSGKTDKTEVLNTCLLLLKEKCSINDECTSKLLSILNQVLLLLDGDQLYSIADDIIAKCKDELISCINTKNNADSELHCIFRPETSVRILEIVLNVVLTKQEKGRLNENRELSTFVSGDLQTLLLFLIRCRVPHISLNTALYLIPKFLLLEKDEQFLLNLWAYLVKDKQRNELTHISNKLQLLCALEEFYLPEASDTDSTCMNIVSDNDFWNLIQEGLINPNPLVRKQALYLMKRTVNIKSRKNSTSLPCLDKIFWWDCTCSCKIWEQFFLLVETLEEKQVHIIKPVLPVVDFLAELSSEPCKHGHVFHESWLLCIFHRLIRHDSNSIVNWGISNFVRVYKIIKFSHHYILHFIGAFLDAFNESSLYYGNINHFVIGIGKELSDLFQFVIESDSNSQTFFRCVLDKMFEIPWAPVPLLHVSFALSCTPSIGLWHNEELKIVKNFIIEALRCQYVFIRGAVQCMFLDAIIHLTDHQSVDIFSVADLLGSFRSSESLKRGTSAWRNIVQWLKSMFNKEEASTFVSKVIPTEKIIDEKVNMSSKSAALMIILLFDSDLLPHNTGDKTGFFTVIVQRILSPFDDCMNRIYASETLQIQSLDMVIALLKESETITDIDSLHEEDMVKRIILDCVNAELNQIFPWFCRKMMSVSHFKDYYLVRNCLSALEIFTKELKFLPEAVNNITKLKETATVAVNMSNTPPICKYFGVQALFYISRSIALNSKCSCNTGSCVIFNKLSIIVEMLLEGDKLVKPPEKEEAELQLTRDLQMLWGKLTSEYIEAVWSILAMFLQGCCSAVNHVLLLRSFKSIISDCVTALEIGGRNVLVPVMKVIEKLLSMCSATEDKDSMLKLITLCWNDTFELRKSELFWTAMEAFIQMLYQPFVMTNSDYHVYVLQYAEKIFWKGQTVTGLCNLLIVQLQKTVAESSGGIFNNKILVPVLTAALTFGPVHRKDQRVITEACLFIASLGEKCSVNALIPNDCYADSEVRARALQLVLQLLSDKGHCHIANELVTALLEKDRVESSSKARYYSDSQLHRLKHRVLQNILILEPYLNSEEGEKLLEWLHESLLKESQQPSVRYQQEWLIVRILMHFTHFKEHLWNMFQEAQEKRPGSICSFIAVTYHLANVLSDEKEAFIDRGIREILPFCMAQHFSIRLYAQTTLQKLFELCKKEHLESLVEKYAIVEQCLQTSIEHGNAVKNAQKIQEDFYFKAFQPVQHYSLEAIFYDVPRLANITQEELIPLHVLRSCKVTETEYIKMESRNCLLKSFSVAAWVLKPSGFEEEDKSIDTSLQNNFQKKLIPWRSLIPDKDLRPSTMKCKAKKEGLIVVASLIDRLPNLGGLSRTCEIFGVSEYVIGNLKYIEDKQFQNLSVTAEQWIPILEVKPHLLAKYLESKKKMGYTLIGAEQTANSTRLNDLKFPVKTVLLLGSEKEGIPANLLPALDMCVEVPQHGVVRSLNVHVTGALFIWEYTKQHTPS